jgi:dTDP-4-dehydrorhamnose reductase
MPEVQLWGGIECTVNRIGDTFHSQLQFTGHDRRTLDLEAIASLGIRTLRYPVLWELTDPGAGNPSNWEWPARQLQRLRELAITPIVGLVHHGSGPPHTSLLSDSFAPQLAAYAAEVARRFPWLIWYTPVNEPLTTARFSALYGLWYPHSRDDHAFVRALINQCRATVLAMQAIRRINPSAQLLQTEDLGKAHSTAALCHQADFENRRRWLTWDLLCGRVDRDHPLYAYLVGTGIGESEVLWFTDHTCPPDLIGINYYVTSERFLHDRVELFPEHCRGVAYTDVEAVRIVEDGCGAGIAELLTEAWQRYGLPLAITETHLGCSREEQMRWLYEAWQAARCMNEAGVDVRAVTSWALFGSYDWSSLLTQFKGAYESGAFDVRGGLPRPTAVGRLIRELTSNSEPRHLALLGLPGWWRRPGKLLRTPEGPPEESRLLNSSPKAHPSGPARPVLIVGATGTLGQAFGRLCEVRGLPFVMTNRRQLDIGHKDSVSDVIETVRPWAVINAAGYVRVDDAEADIIRCQRENVRGPHNLAAECAKRGLPLVTFSSDLVFDGSRYKPYVETDAVSPLNVYGRSKAAAESLVLAVHAAALVIRTSAFFGPWDAHNFLTATLSTLARGGSAVAAENIVVSPTYVPDLVNACLDLVFDGACGIWHLTNHGATSWADFARAAALRARIPVHSLRPAPATELGYTAQRPTYSAMTSARGVLMRPLEDAIEHFLQASDFSAACAT